VSARNRLGSARRRAEALGRWAWSNEGADPKEIRWAVITAAELLARLGSAVDFPGYPFACTGGRCLHTSSCFHAGAGLWPWPDLLTRSEAEAFLRNSPEHRRCKVCQPDIPDAPWVRVRSPGGQVRVRLAEDVSPPGEVL